MTTETRKLKKKLQDAAQYLMLEKEKGKEEEKGIYLDLLAVWHISSIMSNLELTRENYNQ
jgi:hypothetical protein